MMVVLFSCIELQTGVFKMDRGYSVFWLMVLYCMGALAKRGRVFERKRTVTLAAMWMACIFLTWYVQGVRGSDRLTSYVSPTILASGFIMVVMFSRLKLKGTIISKLSPLAFGIYLFHLNPILWRNLRESTAFAAHVGVLAGVAYVFGIAALIFTAGLTVEFIRSRLAKAMKIPELSRRIVGFTKRLLEKVSVVLN